MAKDYPKHNTGLLNTVKTAEEIITLAKLPSREGLYAMILSCIQAPIRGVACAIKAVADAKEENA